MPMNYKVFVVEFLLAMLLLAAILLAWDVLPMILLLILAAAFFALIVRIFTRSWRAFFAKAP